MRLPASFAVIGDVQWLPGYCVLLGDDPAVSRLTDLVRPRRLDFLDSMDRLGEAVELACGATDPASHRINLEILGNTDAFLHAYRKIQLCVKFSSDVVIARSLAAPALGLAAIGAAHSQEDDQPDEH
jgi:hypothetical protein